MSTSSRSRTAEASPLKTLSIVLAFTAAIGMVLGTAGFSAMDADRGVEVSVVDDGEAYLGSDAVGPAVDGKSTTLFELKNRFGADIESVDVESDQYPVDAPDVIDAGEKAPVNVTVQCDGADRVDVSLDVTATTDGVTVDTTLTGTFDCLESGNPPDAAFFGVGNAEIRGPPAAFDGGLNVTVETTDGEFDLTVTESGERVRSGGSGRVSGQIKAIKFPDFDVRVANPSWSGS